MESNPDFQAKPDDADHTALWQKSRDIVDRAYYGRDKLSPQDLVVLDAAIRLRAINEPVLRARISKLNAELEDYKARVEGGEQSRGGKTRKVGDPAPAAKAVSWVDDLKSSLKAAG